MSCSVAIRVLAVVERLVWNVGVSVADASRSDRPDPIWTNFRLQGPSPGVDLSTKAGFPVRRPRPQAMLPGNRPYHRGLLRSAAIVFALLWISVIALGAVVIHDTAVSAL